jgi:hypothetical protein
MRNFLEWVELNEGMSVMVADYNYSSDIKNIEDVCHMLMKNLVYPMLSSGKLKTSAPHVHDTIVPDGNYYASGTEVINFYTFDFDEQSINAIMSGIKYYLDEMHIKYGPFKKEKSGMHNSEVFRIPVLSLKKTNNNAPSLDLSNTNAILIFRELLGYHGEHSFMINAKELYNKISSLTDDMIKIHVRDMYSSQRPSGALSISYGLSFDDIKLRLEEIKKIALWAINNKFDQISVG